MMKSWPKRIFNKKDRSDASAARCAAGRCRVVLHLEELESRLVPSATVQFSTGAETVNVSAGMFSIPVTLSGDRTPTITTFASGFNTLTGLAIDAAGNLYVTNFNNNPGSGTVSKVTPAGVVSTFASGFSNPAALAFDAAGNLYVSNVDANTVSEVTPAGVVSTFASGFSRPDGLAFDAAGNLYVASGNDLDKVTPAGVVSTFVSGVGLPGDIAFDAAGNLYVANEGATPFAVDKVTPAGVVSLFASGFNIPSGLAFDTAGNLYVGNLTGPPNGNTVSKVTPGGTVSTFASGFKQPNGLAFDAAGNLYVGNSQGDTVSKVSETVTVPFTLGGTAVNGVDYSGVTASPLTFGIGQTTANITGTRLPDPGASTTLTVTLGTPTNAALGSPAVNTLTIPPETADQRFIANIYIDLLHRPVDPTGLAFWTGQLAQGVSRTNVALGIEHDPGHEFYQAEVQFAFEQYLNRAADPTALTAGANFLAAGNTLEQLDANIVQSPEYQADAAARGGFNMAFYEDALGRPLGAPNDPPALPPLTPAQITAVFASSEYHTEVAIFLYQNLLNRSFGPSDPPPATRFPLGTPDDVQIADIIGDPGNEYFNKTVS